MGMLKQTVAAIRAGDLNAKIEFLFCNRDPGQRTATDQFLLFAKRAGIPVVTLSSYKFRRQHGDLPWARLREPFDEAVIARLGAYNPKISVAAGFMLVTPLVCERFPMVNLHPALPGGPTGTWQDVTWQLIGARARESGAMMHVATRQVDAGPVLTYTRFPIVGGELDWMWFRARQESVEDMKRREGENSQLFQAIRRLGLERERPLLNQTLKAIASGAIDPGNPPAGGPLDLTREVEAAIAAASPEQ